MRAHTCSQQIWGLVFVVTGLTYFGAFFYAAVISKLVAPSDNPLISAIQQDRYIVHFFYLLCIVLAYQVNIWVNY